MKVHILIILVSFFICYANEKNAKEDEASLGSASVLLSRYLLMNSIINLSQSQQSKFSNTVKKRILKIKSNSIINLLKKNLIIIINKYIE